MIDLVGLSGALAVGLLGVGVACICMVRVWVFAKALIR